MYGQSTLYFKPINTDDYYIKEVQDVTMDKIGRHWVVANQKLFVIENGKTSLANEYISLSTKAVKAAAIEGDNLFVLHIDGEYSKINLLDNTNQKSSLSNTLGFEIVNNKVFLKSNNAYYTPYHHQIVTISNTSPSILSLRGNELIEMRNNKNTIIYTNKKFIDNKAELYQFYDQFYALENGILYELSKEVFSLSQIISHPTFNSSDVRSCLPLGNDTYFLSFNESNGLFIYQNNAFVNISRLPQNKKYLNDRQFDIIYHATLIDKENILLLSAGGKTYNLNIQSLLLSENKNLSQLNITFKNLFNDKYGNVWLGSYTDKLVKYSPKNKNIKVFTSKDCSDIYDIYRIYEDRNGLIWLGMTKGLIGLNPNTEKFITFGKILTQKNIDLNQIGVSALEHDAQNRLWVGTYDYGLHYINYDDIRTQDAQTNIYATSLLENMTFPETDIKYLNINDDKLLIRASNGLVQMDLNNLMTKVWSTKEGFPLVLNNNYNYIEDNKYYIFGAFGGIGKVDLNYTPTSKQYPIKSLYTNGQQSHKIYPLLINKQLKIEEDISVIQALVSDLDQLPQWPKYIYQYNDSTWLKPAANNIVILTTDKGTKNLKLKQQYKSILYDADSQFEDYILELKEIWFMSTGFLTFVFLAVASMIYLLLRYYIKSKRYKSLASALEMESLRGQMNPHFISNALNSINYYILENKTDAASQFIIKFSKLIRKILNNTGHEYITIQEEIESLKMYIDMEKMRFKEKFTYDIEVADDLDRSYLVPSMILQPIVENAIWHGIMQKSTNGHLSINVHKENNYVQVLIKDDGIGMKKSKEIKSKQSLKRKSFGQGIVQRRLELLNSSHKKNYSIIYSNLYTETKENPGTLVTLNL